MDIGIASVAVAITLDADGRCTACRIALGAVSPAPLRAGAGGFIRWTGALPRGAVVRLHAGVIAGAALSIY